MHVWLSFDQKRKLRVTFTFSGVTSTIEYVLNRWVILISISTILTILQQLKIKQRIPKQSEHEVKFQKHKSCEHESESPKSHKNKSTIVANVNLGIF